MQRFYRGWFIPVVLVMLFVFSRTYHLLVMPPFIDEYLHILWARDVYQGRFLTGAENGRLLALWYMSLFQMSGNGLLWIARAVTVLFAALNVAVIYNLGRLWVSRSTGAIGALVYILAPYVFFHERLALSDAYVASFGLLALWFGVRFARQQRSIDAILSGLMVTLAITSKATGLMLVVIPGLCILLSMPLRKSVRGLLFAYGSFAATAVPLLLVLRWRHYDYFGIATQVVGTGSTAGMLDRLTVNLGVGWSFTVTYMSVVVTAFSLFLALYLIVRRKSLGLMLVACTLLPFVGILAFASKISGRYLLLHVPILILTASIALGVLAKDLNKRFPIAHTGTAVALLGVLAWGILFALPFQVQAWRDDSGLALPFQDRVEYIEADSSGYGLKDVAAYLQARSKETGKTVYMMGLLSNCGSLSLLLPADSAVEVECPHLMWTGQNQSGLSAIINERAASAKAGTITDLWIATEDLPYATLDGTNARYEKVVVFARPGTLSKITLYRVITS